MPFDGNGVFSYTPTTVTPAVGSTTIDSAEFNTFTADLATALSLCLTEDGQNEPTANLPMNGNKHTGVANGAARNDYTAIGQLQDGAVVYGSAGGAADVQTLTLSPAITAYSAGQRFSFVPVANNTGACTLNVNAVGDKSIKLVDGTDPAANDLNSSGIAEVIYNGTNFILINPATFTATALAALTATWANKTLTSPVINTPVINTPVINTQATGTAIKDEDDMASDSAVHLVTQQSVKAYVDGSGLIQMVSEVDTVYQNTTSRIPLDNSIPTVSEGLSLVDVVITPKYADSKLVFTFDGIFAIRNVVDDAITQMAVTLVDVTGGSVIYAVANNVSETAFASMDGGYCSNVPLHHVQASPGTSARTYRIRVGVQGTSNQTLYINGSRYARIFGGVAGCRLTVTEVK